VDREGLKLASRTAEGMLKGEPLGHLRIIRLGEHYLLLPNRDRDWFEKNGPDTFRCLHKEAARVALEEAWMRSFRETAK
jgi:hypothetical protein